VLSYRIVSFRLKSIELIRRRVLDKAHKLAMEGTPKQAKYASRFLAFTRKDDRCSDLVDVSLLGDRADM